MSTAASMIWKEILDASIGSTRLLADQEWEKVQGPSGTTIWINKDGHRLTNVAMYDASISG